VLRLSPDEILNRGFGDFESLAPLERIVFVLLEFECLMEMEGWDDFFTSKWSCYYPEMKRGLLLAGDLESLEVLQDYETHLIDHGVSLDPSSLDAFLCSQNTDYFTTCRDWNEDYSQLKDHRWRKIRDYLVLHNIALLA
jgi:hypothetical protein